MDLLRQGAADDTFADGVNLAQLLKTGRISPKEALAIVPQICDALQYAHDQGIVHRDIKTDNLLLDRTGPVKVADFGIAKMVVAHRDRRTNEDDGQRRSQTDATKAGKIIGTPQYMAPEQIERPSDVDHRADIYALGVVSYQMLTGELPEQDLQAPSRKLLIDVRLDEIVLKAMENDPERRYQQASMMKTWVDGLRACPPVSKDEKPNLAAPGTPQSNLGTELGRKLYWSAYALFVLVPAISLSGLLVINWFKFSKTDRTSSQHGDTIHVSASGEAGAKAKEDAEDLTQAFFAKLLERRDFAGLKQENDRFLRWGKAKSRMPRLRRLCRWMKARCGWRCIV